IYVPRNALARFLDDVRRDVRQSNVDLISGTIRLVERDDETVLAWARAPWACVIFNIHTVHTPAGIERSAAACRRRIDPRLRSAASRAGGGERGPPPPPPLTAGPGGPGWGRLTGGPRLPAPTAPPTPPPPVSRATVPATTGTCSPTPCVRRHEPGAPRLRGRRRRVRERRALSDLPPPHPGRPAGPDRLRGLLPGGPPARPGPPPRGRRPPAQPPPRGPHRGAAP